MTPATGELLYVYTVLRTAPPASPPLALDVHARLGTGLEFVEHQGLTAVVEPVDPAHFDEQPLRAHLEDLDWLAGVAGAHHEVVARVGRGTTTVPLRLATICRGRQGVQRMLAEARQPISEALQRVTDAEEWGVKLYAQPAPDSADPDPAPAPGAAAQPATAEPGSSGSAPTSSGRDYLRRRLSDRRAQADRTGQAQRAAEALHEELAYKASGAVLHPPQQRQLSQAPGQNVLNAAYLVPTAHREAFLDSIPAADDLPQGVRVEVTGPWVPYSFTHTTAAPAQPS
ncbi:GvpL/GvpF family gas vesicle protein [Streptomyces sp. NBC_01565]|uniref:GvpL/GvpF family gas vesicle protein n=1 Tax=unclassified Streptomyces TaxID=2593676 RepID=UPI002259A862|nr:GvpL/GvpF family gas vesicle protein [Streptomyces sp. NBC_01565]MCX4547126.1 GvpL/GvpF family gas vesicle protein [Streptomyces sp. NBC_01565]